MPGEWEDVGPALDQPRNAPPGPLPKGGEKGLATRVSYSPDEQARVQAQEAELQDSNLQSITRELANPKLGAKQRAVLEDELAGLQTKPKTGDGWEDLGPVKQPRPKGFAPSDSIAFGGKELMLPQKETLLNSQDNLAHVKDLWRNESMVGHLYNAYQKGVFTKTLGELVKSVPEKVKDFSLPQLWAEAKKDPEQFVGALFDSVIAEPIMMAAPVGLGGSMAKTFGAAASVGGKVAGAAGKVVGRAAETGIAGGALMTPIAIAEQLDKSGYVDPRQLDEDFKMGITMGAVLGTAMHLGADLAGVKPSEVQAKVKKGVVTDNLGPVEALQKAFDEFGIPPEKSGPIMEEVVSHDNFEKANAMYSEQVKKGLNPEPPVRQDVVTRQKEVAALLKSKETFESQAPAAEAQRAQPVATTLEQPTPVRVNEQFDRGEVLGAPAALAKDAAERTEADWVALRAQAKLQDAKASDGGKAAIPELSKDTNLGQQIVGRELPNVVKAKAALELPEQVRTVDDLAAIEAENMKVKGPYTPLTQFWPMVGVGTVAAGVGYAFDPNWERDLAMGAGAVLAVKAKGGMWHPEAVSRLAQPLSARLHTNIAPELDGDAFMAGTAANRAKNAWAEKSIRNYLNKHAGTESDPLKGVEIPFGQGTKPWGEVMDAIVGSSPAKYFGPEGKHQSLLDIARSHPEEPIWSLREGRNNTIPPGARATGDYGAQALTSYLSHVGDYLREFVPSEKLGQYDLVRAVKETAAQDIKQAKKMAEARASGAGTTVFKEYPDGMKWVEVGKGSSKDVNEAALKNEGDVMGHCVGGYCEDVHQGYSKIFSLRDAKGESHVTVEVRPVDRSYKDWKEVLGPEQFLKESKEFYSRTGLGSMEAQGEFKWGLVRKYPKQFGQDILQIKGKQNRAPVAAYLPYVQDFVKGGKWGEVGDLQNTGLAKYNGEFLSKEDARVRGFISDSGMLTDLGRGQRGSIDPEFARYLAITAVGAGIGGYLADDKATGLLYGAGLTAGGLIAIRTAGKILGAAEDALGKITFGPRDTRFRIDSQMQNFGEAEARTKILGMRVEKALKELVPNVKRQEELTHFIERGGPNGPRTAAEQEAVRMTIEFNRGEFKLEQAAGVIETGIEDGSYMGHFWDIRSDADKLKAQRLFAAMSAHNPHAQQRSVFSYAAGIEAGLKPKTLSFAEITGKRLEVGGLVIAKHNLLKALKEGILPDDSRILLPKHPPEGEAARRAWAMATAGYKDSPHPALAQYKIHPDIEPSLRVLYAVQTPNAALDAMNLVSSASKRAIFSLSAFHPKSLFDVMVGMSRFLRAGPRAWSKLPAARRAWSLNGNEELLHSALVDGQVKVDPKKGVDIEYDLLQRAAGRLIDNSAKWTSKSRAAIAAGGAGGGLMASDYEPGGALAGAILAFGGGRKAIQMTKWLDGKSQELLWGKLHPIFKIATFGAEYERRLGQNAIEVARGGAGKPLKQIAREVGGSVNDLFGGQNWQASAEAVQSKYLRNFSLALAQPDSMRLLQLLALAPDWTVSTFKAIAKAIPGITDKDVAALHRSYIINSMLMYATLGDALNVYFSGHHFWENKDWTRLDLGDGRTMQLSKHFMEFFHWMGDPGQTFDNKLGFWPSEVQQQIENRKWLTGGNRKPAPNIAHPEDSLIMQLPKRAAHLGKRFIPIWGSQETGEQAAYGAAGLPIYSETYERRDARLERQKEQRNTPEAKELRRTKRELKREKENR